MFACFAESFPVDYLYYFQQIITQDYDKDEIKKYQFYNVLHFSR